jgi:pimeloyl-ACP methyl ester carboxylesterase
VPALNVTGPDDATSVALVLHGGRSSSRSKARARHLAVLRMKPFAASLHAAGGARGLAVARLRYALRGWNGDLRSPVADARWALEQLHERFPGAPVALVGHSMGGRTAVHVADDPLVTAVVGLAPWLEPGDPVVTMAGRRLLMVHGDRDRTTSAAAARRYVEAARPVAASAAFVTVRGDGHAMISRPRVWHSLTTAFVTAALLGDAAPLAEAGVQEV